MVVRVEVLNTVGDVLFTLDIDGGSVEIDRTAGGARRTARWTVPGTLESITPVDQDPNVLLPYGTEVRILRGIDYGTSTELLPLGIFRITEVEPDRASDGGSVCSFAAMDRAERLSRSLIAPFTANPGTNYGSAIIALLTQAWTGASDTVVAPPFQFTETTHQTPLLHVDEQSNPWDEAQNWAKSCGKELYVDWLGNVVLADVPDITTATAVNSFVDGLADTRVQLTRHYSSLNTPNYIVVNGTNSAVSEQGVVGTAIADDPALSIDVNGAYGTVPRWIDSDYVMSNTQATDQARAELAKVLAGTDTLSIAAIPDPRTDAGDVVSVTAGALAVYDRLYVVSQVSIPLDASSPMTMELGRG